MSRLAAILVFCLALTPLQGASPLLTLKNELLPSPTGVGSSSPEFSRCGDGLIVLSWTAASSAQRRALFDPQARAWKEPHSDSALTTPRTTTQTGEIIVHEAGRSAKVWLDSTGKTPSILLSIKPGPRENFLMPVHIEDERPCGAPDLVLLADGTVFVSWPEHYNQSETALWLRRISPGGLLSVPVLLAVLPGDPTEVRLALIKDFDENPAQFVLTYSIGEGETSQIMTRLLTIDRATDNIRRSPCHNCPDADEAARGYALRGHVVSFSTEQNTLTLQHNEITGVLPAGKTTFKVDPAVLKAAAPNNELFARIEKRGGNWWLFGASWVVRAEP